MKAGALLSLLLVGSAALAQQDATGAPTKIEATSFTTANGTVVVNFTTEDRDEFYELLARIGSTDRWAYSVGWKPHYLLSVYVVADPSSTTAPTAASGFGEVLSSLDMESKAIVGRTDVFFRGKRSKVLKITADGEYVSLSAENVPSLVVLAGVAESQRLSYRVTYVSSVTVPMIEFDRLKAAEFWGFWSRAAHLKITRWSNFVEVSGSGAR
ncbi:MAG: hypothetical protein IH944_13850 [Armatimonadetes bacterium]|nr:hypothetical protein [Armatimonadota bacterium]